MKCAAVVSFAGGLLLGSCITLFGLRGFLLRQDTLLRQSSEKLAQSAQSARKPAGPFSQAPPPVRPGSPPRVPRAPSHSPGQDPSGVRKCWQRSCLGVAGKLSALDYCIWISPRIKSDSATIFRRFRNEISAIPQPRTDTLPQAKKDDSATTIRAIQKPKSASHSCGHTQYGIVSRCGGVGLGGVGWDNNVLAAAFSPRHTCCRTQHSIVSR